MSYQHCLLSGEVLSTPVGKVVCIGRNYADHAAELNNPIPTEPLVFMKPASSLVALDGGFSVPDDKGIVHFETEMALLIGQPMKNVSPEAALAGISHVAIALDLTLRDVQSALKAKGHPWEKAKAFDGACPVSGFIPVSDIEDLQDVTIALSINDEERQRGSTALMLNKVADMVSHMSESFTLDVGDVILTGTPAGVGPINKGDQLCAELVGHISVQSQVL